MDQLSIIHAFQSESTFLVDVPASILHRPTTTGVRLNRSRVSGNDGTHEAFMNALSLSVDPTSNLGDNDSDKKELSVMRVVPINGSRAFHKRFLARCESYCRLCCRLQRGVEWLFSRRSRHHRSIKSNAAVDDSTVFDVDRLSHLVFPVEPTAFVAAAFALPSIISVVPAASDEESTTVTKGVGGEGRKGGDDVGSLKDTRVIPYCFFYGFPEQRVLRGQSVSDHISNDSTTNTNLRNALAAEASRMTLMDRFLAVSNATGVCGAASTMHNALGMNNRTRIGLTLAAYLECRLPRSVSGPHKGSPAPGGSGSGIGGVNSSSEWSREDPFSCWSDDVLWRLLGLLVSALAVVHAAGFHFRGELSTDDVLCFALPDSSEEESHISTPTSSTTTTRTTTTTAAAATATAVGANTMKRNSGIESIAHHLVSRTTASESHWLITDTTPAHHAFFVFTTPPRSLFAEEMRGGEEEEEEREENAAEIGAAQRRDTAALGRILVAVVAEAKRRRGARGTTSCSELLFVAERMAAVGESVNTTSTTTTSSSSANGGVLGEAPAHRFAQLQAVQLRTHLWLLRSILEERDTQIATFMFYLNKSNNDNNNNTNTTNNNNNNNNASNTSNINNHDHNSSKRKDTSNIISNNIWSDGKRNGNGGKVTDHKYPSLTNVEAYMAELEEREKRLEEREEKLNQFLLLYELTSERLDQLPAGKESFERLRQSLVQTPRSKTLSAASALPVAKSLPIPTTASSSPTTSPPNAAAAGPPRASTSPLRSVVPPIAGVAAITTGRATNTTNTAAVATARGLPSTSMPPTPGVSTARAGPSSTHTAQQTVQTTTSSSSPQKVSTALSWSSLAQQPYPRSSRRTVTTESTTPSDKTRPLYGLLRFQKTENSSGGNANTNTNANISPTAADMLASHTSPVGLLGKEGRVIDGAPQNCSPRVTPGGHTQRASTRTNTPSMAHSNSTAVGHTALAQGTMSTRTPTASSSVRRQKSVSPIVTSRSYNGRAESPAVVGLSTVSSTGREKVIGRPASSKLTHSTSLAAVPSSTTKLELPLQHVTPVRANQRTPLTGRPRSVLATPDVSPLVRTTDDNSSLLLPTSYKTPPRTTPIATPLQSRGSPGVHMLNKVPTPHSTTPLNSSKAHARPSMSPRQTGNLVSAKNVSTTTSHPTLAAGKLKSSHYDPSLYMHGSKETGHVAAIAASLSSSSAPSPSSTAPSPSPAIAAVGMRTAAAATAAAAVPTATTPTAAKTMTGRKSSGKTQPSGYGVPTKSEEKNTTVVHMMKLSEERSNTLLMTMNNSRETLQHHLQERKGGSTAVPTTNTTTTTTTTATTTNNHTPITTNKVRTPGARIPSATNFSPHVDDSIPITVSLDISAGLECNLHVDSQKPSSGSQQLKKEREEGMTPRTARSRLAGDGWVNHHLAALEQLRYDFQQSEVIKSARNTPNGKSALRGSRDRVVDSIDSSKLSPDHDNVGNAAAWGATNKVHSSAAAHASTTSARCMY
ncbi:uncharacterized protein TM35_000361410 [Trypanosoma theileri]|uniref:Uncharacterized protein n=1 Tax=Trypanosoma theileri TaxID=67003 RepID=A0A1X0NL27_9TRYP|nr:uncharacterized protein TM35_000361410 [Trypanosoma theileri]ORC85281.1 hypothetical protein TM35_000361410 [Trypanosoma theileri]